MGTKRNIEDYTEKYLSAPFLKENVKYRRACVLENLKKYNPMNILEIGCGFFPLFQWLRGGYSNYYVVEPSIVFAEHAKEIAQSNEKIVVYTGFFETEYEKLLNKKLDFIICSSLLHEVPDDELLLELIWKVATEQTVIHINVPNAISMHRLIAKEMGMIDSIYEKSETQDKLQQREVYDLDKLKNKAIKKNFNIIDEGSYFIKPFTHLQMSQMLKCGIIDENVLRGLQGIIKYFPHNGSEIYINMRKIKGDAEDG